MRSVIISAPAPFGLLSLSFEQNGEDCLPEIVSKLRHSLPDRVLQECLLRPTYGGHSDSNQLFYSLLPRLLGGKGGFGSQLRSSKSKKSKSNITKDAGKDVSGRRLRTLQKAERLAQALKDLPQREKAARLAKREELERLINAEPKVERFDDTEYFDDCEVILKDIKDAMQGLDEEEESGESSHSTAKVSSISQPRKLEGWDEEDDEDSGEDEAEEETNVGKGKGKSIPSAKRRKMAK